MQPLRNFYAKSARKKRPAFRAKRVAEPSFSTSSDLLYERENGVQEVRMRTWAGAQQVQGVWRQRPLRARTGDGSAASARSAAAAASASTGGSAASAKSAAVAGDRGRRVRRGGGPRRVRPHGASTRGWWAARW
eukprot:scaffold56447_cov54-Phaeocystis_antarctica.AAC.2